METINTIKLSRPELLLQPNLNDCDIHKKFVAAIQITFDVPEALNAMLDEVSNRDLLWCPENENVFSDVSETVSDIESSDQEDVVENVSNYYHWLTQESTQREPLSSMFSYLFENVEPYYHEPYSFSNKEKEYRQQFYKYLNQKYKNVDEYINRIAKCLYIKPEEVGTFGICQNIIQRKVWK